MVSLYKVRNGELVFVDRATEEKMDAYGQQGYICVHEPDPQEPYRHLVQASDFLWMEPQPGVSV